jgi:Tfp pilus assembly PilM family ATPase
MKTLILQNLMSTLPTSAKKPVIAYPANLKTIKQISLFERLLNQVEYNFHSKRYT